MISDTLRQKFIYSVPFKDDGFPLVVLDNLRDDTDKCEILSGQSLYFWDEKDFKQFVETKKDKIQKLIIVDDYKLKSNNQRLKAGLKCYLISFAYQFKKAGFRCSIQ